MNPKHQSKAEKKVHDEILHFLKSVLNHQFDEASVEIGRPPQQDMGDYAVACFAFAKKSGQKASIFTQSLAEQFEAKKLAKKGGKLLVSAKALGPYLNFFVDHAQFSRLVLEQILKEGQVFGNSQMGRGKRVMVEYSQPNTHKEFHVGHLRTTFIGATLVNLYRALGYKVYGVNYIGDIGAHVAKCLWEYVKFHKDTNIPAKKGRYLGGIYADAVSKIEEHEEYKQEVALVQQKLERGDAALKALWRKTRRWSLEEFYAIYRKLGIHFDHYFFESDVERPGKKIIQELLKKGIARVSEGAVVVDLEDYGLKTFLLLKSDGTALYSTKDLALAKLKFKKYRIDKSYYVVDYRQTLYFKQLFKVLEIMGFTKEMAHISYNSVNTKEGAMSSRSGNLVLYEDFEKQLLDKAFAETKRRHPLWKRHRIEQTARSIAYAAIKHDMLASGNDSVITFDMRRSLQFHGMTGPYLLYVYARIASILKKARGRMFSHIDWSVLDTQEERELISYLSQFPTKVQRAAETFEPSVVTQYLHDLAKSFSTFYQQIPVLQSSDKVRHARLALISAVMVVIEQGLRLLGIDVVEQM